MSWQFCSGLGRGGLRARRQSVARSVAERLETRRLLSVSVLSYHNDATSSGANLAETSLTPANVATATFGKLFSTPVDGQIYGQPLYVPGVNITTGSQPGTHNVAFVATEGDSLYAIDSTSGAVLWHDSLLNADPALTGGGNTVTVTTVPNADVNTSDINPQIGITTTPAIDAATNSLFVTAKTKQVVNGATATPNYVYTLYKVNIQNGSYTSIVIGDTNYNTSTKAYTYVNGPYVGDPADGGAGVVTAGFSVSVNTGTSTVSTSDLIYFNALRQMNRSAITIYNGTVYMGFASHGDNTPYHGWILGYSESNLAPTAVFNVDPNGSDDGIWMSGNRIDIDSQGYMYVVTGNGTFDTTLNAQGFPVDGDYGDSFVKIALDPTTSAANENINGWGLKVVDYFTPMNQGTLSSNDQDVGSGGPVLLPETAGSVTIGSAAHPDLLVGAGKEGRIYLIDRNNMGHYSGTTDNVVQELANALPGGSYDTPAFFFDGTTARIYYAPSNHQAVSFTIANAVLTADHASPDVFGSRDATTSISANGTANGIAWDIDPGSNQLRAYNASNISQELYTSAQAGVRDLLGTATKFSTPTIADGLVFVGTAGALVVYGELAPPTTAPAAPTNLTAAAVSGVQINLTWADNSNNEGGFDIEDSTDGGNTFTQVATASVNAASYDVTGLQPGQTYTFRVRAFNILGNSAYTNTAAAATISQAPTVNFVNGFSNVSGVMTLNGKAAINAANLELTDGNTNETSSAYTTTPVSVTRFNSVFTFQLLNPTADGFTFVIENAGVNAIGPGGGGLGYGGTTGGIAFSVAVKFDLYNNSGEGTDSTGLYTDGATPEGTTGSFDMTSSGVNLHSGDPIQAVFTYDGTTLTEKLTDTYTNAVFTHSYAINIPATVGANTAYVGFTGASGGATAIQNILSWTYTALPAPPATPTNLAVTPASGTELDVSWSETSSTPVDHFDILKLNSSNVYVQIAQVPATQTLYPDSGPGLTEHTTYSYEVIAENAGGASAPAGPASGTTPYPPAGPSNLVYSNIGTNTVTLTWQDNATNAQGYKIVRQLASNNSDLIATLGPTATTYTDSTLAPGSPYEYIVGAYNLAGPSNAENVFFQTIALAPTNLVAAGGGDEVHLAWTASFGATGYNIYRGTSPGGENITPVANLTTTSFTDTGLTPGKTYYYEVSAVDGGGQSNLSTESSSVAYLPGDINGDGTVNFADLVILAQHYGLASGATWAEGDLNGDGAVNFADLVILVQNYNQSLPVAAASAPSFVSASMSVDPAPAPTTRAKTAAHRLGHLFSSKLVHGNRNPRTRLDEFRAADRIETA